MARLALEPRTLAFRARLGVEVLGELLAHHERVGLAIPPLEVGNDAFERMLSNHRLAAVGKILKRDSFLFAAIEDHLLDAFGQAVERLF